MNKRTIGIVGGYGETGRAVAAELVKSCDDELLIGGRDRARLDPLAAQLGQRVSAAPVDVLDDRSLGAFCSRCSTVVNCAGPVIRLHDRVAQAALRARCHYIDAAGMSIVKERMLPHAHEIAELGLSFVISAGWMPGLTELLPAYAYAQAKLQMDSIESVSLYFSDSGEWSDNALLDGAWFLRKTGLSRPGYFRRGEWVQLPISESSRKVDLGDPIGFRRFGLFYLPEQSDLGRRLTGCDFRSYSYLSGVQNALTATALALLPLGEDLRVKLLRGVFRRNRLPVRGFAVVHVPGRAANRPAVFKAQVIFEADRDYWMNAVVLAAAARMATARNGVQSGAHFLSEAVEPLGFMSGLRRAGVEQTEALETLA